MIIEAKSDPLSFIFESAIILIPDKSVPNHEIDTSIIAVYCMLEKIAQLSISKTKFPKIYNMTL